MPDEKQKRQCVLCAKPDTEIPLVQLSYNEKDHYLCPEHLPILIHQPEALIGKLPGAENMQAG